MQDKYLSLVAWLNTEKKRHKKNSFTVTNCRNTGLFGIWSVRYRTEKKLRYRKRSGTGIVRCSPAFFGSGTGLRWMPMPALVFWMQMPTFAKWTQKSYGKDRYFRDWNIFLKAVFSQPFSGCIFIQWSVLKSAKNYVYFVYPYWPIWWKKILTLANDILTFWKPKSHFSQQTTRKWILQFDVRIFFRFLYVAGSWRQLQTTIF
jgi:hypothetical protein